MHTIYVELTNFSISNFYKRPDIYIYIYECLVFCVLITIPIFVSIHVIYKYKNVQTFCYKLQYM